METFLQELFGKSPIEIQLAWYILGFIGAVFGFLVRQASYLESHPLTWKQMVIGFLTAFVFIRFGKALTGLEPTPEGAFLIGVFFNEIALMIIKKKK